MGILDHLLARHDTEPLGSLEEWWALHREVRRDHEVPVDATLAMAPRMDRLGWVFASAYCSALEQLFGERFEEGPAVLCATEIGGAHPRAIETALLHRHDGYRLDGHKAFVTLANLARHLYVLASEGTDPRGRKLLRVVRVPADRPGVHVKVLGPGAFVPEIPHGQLTVEQVRVADGEVLPGDGWQRWVKPFRTVEDCHVQAGLLGWLAGVAVRSGWPTATVEAILGLAAGMRTLALSDPSSRATHLALGSLLVRIGELLSASEALWDDVDPELRDRWIRDRPLLSVAEKARAARLETARGKS